MQISPLDIRNQSFKKKTLGGYDPEEVNAFLQQVANQMEELLRLRTEINEKLKITEERVNYYKLMEKTLQDAVVTMQKTVDEKRRTAQKEAELIIAEAKAEAHREGERIRSQAESLSAEIETLHAQKRNYYIRIRSLIRSQEELLNAMEQEEGGSGAESLSGEALMFRKRKIQQEKAQQLQQAREHLKETGRQPVLRQPPAPPSGMNDGIGNQG
jgi:cell division initiation protein